MPFVEINAADFVVRNGYGQVPVYVVDMTPDVAAAWIAAHATVLGRIEGDLRDKRSYLKSITISPKGWTLHVEDAA